MVVTDVLLRLRWRARRVLWWVVVAGLAVATAAVVRGALASAEAQRAAYGEGRAVLVARHDLRSGHALGPDDMAVRTWPTGLVPADALEADPATATGRVVAATVLAGEPLVATRLAPDGLSAVAALVPEDRRGVLVPAGSGLPPLVVGDHVDLVSAPDTFDGFDPGRLPPLVVARAAPVVAVGDEGATVAVTTDELPATVAALARLAVVAALTGR